jgi:hypothetical protein
VAKSKKNPDPDRGERSGRRRCSGGAVADCDRGSQHHNASAATEPSSAPADIIAPTIARLRDQAAAAAATAPPTPRRGAGHQQPQRADEQRTRQRVAEASRHLFERGWNWSRIADLFQVAGRTLRHWCFHLLERMRSARPLGRPVVRSPREQRNEVIHFLDEFGPQIGVPTLGACFPTMRRAELDALVKRYRRVWREQHREPLRISTVEHRHGSCGFAEDFAQWRLAGKPCNPLIRRANALMRNGYLLFSAMLRGTRPLRGSVLHSFQQNKFKGRQSKVATSPPLGDL